MAMPKKLSGRPKRDWPKGCRCGLPEDSQSAIDGIQWNMTEPGNCKGIEQKSMVSELIEFFKEAKCLKRELISFLNAHKTKKRSSKIKGFLSLT